MNYIDFYSGESTANTEHKYPGLAKLLASISSKEFPLDVLSSLCNKKAFELPSLRSNGTAVLIDCIYTDTAGGRAFLQFEDGNGFFYLAIHYCPIALIVPDELFISLYKIYVTTPEALMSDLASMKQKIDLASPHDNFLPNNELGGIALNSQRPFHFFFELQSVVWNCVKAGIFEADFPFFVSLDSCFYPFWELPNVNSRAEAVHSYTDLNAEKMKKQGLIIPAFLPVNYARVKNLKKINLELTEFDSQIIEYSLSAVEGDLEFKDMLAKLDSCKHIIWFGVCSEKRKWHEQRDAIIAIATKLAAHENLVGIVLDGMTNPLSNISNFRRDPNTSDEQAIYEIKAAMPKNVYCISLKNAQSMLKLAIAKKTDFFMTHHMTDSLYVSRFGGKPGITHQSRVGSGVDAPQYRHSNIVTVPADWITDDDGSNGRSADTSYSIPHEPVVELFFEHFNRTVVNK